MRSIFIEELVSALSGMDPEEQKDVLGSLISPQDVAARMDGSVFNIITRGQGLFSVKALLSEIGIAEDDPRSRYFENTSGYLIDRKYVLSLRAIAAKKETIARNAGGVQITSGGKMVWWIPNAGLAEFAEKIGALQTEYASVADEIYRDYWAIRSESVSNIREAAERTWKDLESASPGCTGLTLSGYTDSAVRTFDERFVTREKIHEKIRLDVLLVDRDYPPAVWEIGEAVRRSSEEDPGSPVPRQLSLPGSDPGSGVEAIRNGFMRESVMGTRDAVDTEVEMRLGELARTLEDAANAENAKGPLYRKLRNQLSILRRHEGTRTSVDRVIAHLDGILESGGSVSRRDIGIMNRLVSDSIDEVIRSISVDAITSEMALLVRDGNANEALRRLSDLKAELEESLSTANIMQSMVLGKVAGESL